MIKKNNYEKSLGNKPFPKLIESILIEIYLLMDVPFVKAKNKDCSDALGAGFSNCRSQPILCSHEGF